MTTEGSLVRLLGSKAKLGIFMGAVYAFLIPVMLIGPERMNHDVIYKDRQEHLKRSTKSELVQANTEV